MTRITVGASRDHLVQPGSLLFDPPTLPQGLRSRRRRSLLPQMRKTKMKKRRVEGSAPRGRKCRWKSILIPLLVLLFIPAFQVAVVRFVDPPVTLPMLIEQVSESGAKAPLRYRWIPFAQIPDMFLKHLWISEDQRFFQHEGFDWKEMQIAMKEAQRKGKPVRGVSTITNQCARSIFLWQGRGRRGQSSGNSRQALSPFFVYFAFSAAGSV